MLNFFITNLLCLKVIIVKVMHYLCKKKTKAMYTHNNPVKMLEFFKSSELICKKIYHFIELEFCSSEIIPINFVVYTG